ncbi:hypothetical protein ACTXT7_015979, partial [Hymenolepis weldensis]
MSRHPFTELVDDEYIRSLPNVTTDYTLDKLKEEYFKRSKPPKRAARKWDFPVNHPIRKELWPFLCESFFNMKFATSIDGPPRASYASGADLHVRLEDPKSTPEAETPMPSPEHQSTELGREWADTRLLPTYHLNERGRKVLIALLHEISMTRPLTFYAPHVWPICAILLHYHRPKVVMECLDMIFSKSKDDRITESGKAWRSRCLAMREILLSNGPLNLPFKVANRSMVKAMEVKGGNMDSQSRRQERIFRIEEANSWMIAIFTLPFEVMVPMVDNFITEGFKVLFRLGLV